MSLVAKFAQEELTALLLADTFPSMSLVAAVGRRWLFFVGWGRSAAVSNSVSNIIFVCHVSGSIDLLVAACLLLLE